MSRQLSPTSTHHPTSPDSNVRQNGPVYGKGIVSTETVTDETRRAEFPAKRSISRDNNASFVRVPDWTDETFLPCEFCDTMLPADSLSFHQATCDKSPPAPCPTSSTNTSSSPVREYSPVEVSSADCESRPQFDSHLSMGQGKPTRKTPLSSSCRSKSEQNHDVAKRYEYAKKTLLNSLKETERSIARIGNDMFQVKLENLHEKVNAVLEIQEEKEEALLLKIKSLTDEIENLKAECARKEKKIQLAQVTWIWEAHLARFVVESGNIYEYYRFSQMNDYLKQLDAKDHNLWEEIQDRVANWTKMHKNAVKSIRKERNVAVHPDLIILDDVEKEIDNMYPVFQTNMRDMLEILKMTASLMKFGRLAKIYNQNAGDLAKPQASLSLTKQQIQQVLDEITLWDRRFEDIDGLQNIEHNEAKKYLKKFIGIPEDEINHYDSILNFIKQENGKELRKLACEFEERHPPPVYEETRQTLEALKKLCPVEDNPGADNPGEDHHNVKKVGFGVDVAKLHIPDFLPKNLWKHGIEIVEKYFK